MKPSWIWLVLIVLGALSTPARSNPPDSIQILLSRGPADWSAMPVAYRRLLYMKREDAPAYPEDADSLLQVRKWPPTRMIDGVLCDLKFASGHYDVIDGLVCCLSSIRPGWNYSTHYVPRSAALGPEGSTLPAPSRTRGPSYHWRSDSTLVSRMYVTSEKWQNWDYDSTGVLTHYEFAPHQSLRRLGEKVSVWFSHEGVLIACSVDGDAYWMGRRGPTGEMFHYLAKYYRWPTYR